MQVILKDTQTGEIRLSDDNHSAYYWAEGNGSCDCNRIDHFDGSIGNEFEAKQRLESPELKEWQSYCYGFEQFIVVNCNGDLEEYETKEAFISMCNENYKL